MIQFKKAVKYEARGRIALIGPAGSGKSWTMLTAARALVGPEGRIAAIDTEHGSLSKYADIFNFDVIEMDSFTPDNFLTALKSAEAAKYDAFCSDSLSHFWMGKDGALEFVDMAAKRHKDNMGGWKDFAPHERAMIDAMVASPCHVLVTMRTKTEYQEQTNPNTGKKQRVKIGLAPVQRQGLEYEFDLVAYMDDENTLITDKTRCPYYSKKAIVMPAAKDFAPFAEWLKGEKAIPKITRPQAEELHAAARARLISNESLLKTLEIERLGDLQADKLDAAKAWIAAQPVPAAPAATTTSAMPAKPDDYDKEVQAYIQAGITMDLLWQYVETLPFSKDLAKVADNLRTTRECYKVEVLSSVIKAAIDRAKPEAVKS